jgi:PPOX class probable F420-dependent enzyme
MKTISDEKRNFIDEFLQAPLIARMATADHDGHPHVVPVWYAWDGKSIWISSFTNTRKITELQQNPFVSVSIDVSEKNGATTAVVLEGKVELIKEPRDLVSAKSLWIYTRYLGEKGVLEKEPQSWVNDPLNLLIKLTPTDFYTW